MNPYKWTPTRWWDLLIGLLIGLALKLIFVGAVHAETRVTLGAGVTNFQVNTPNGTWWQADQPHGFDTLSLALKAGIEQTLDPNWYLGLGYVSLGTVSAWTRAQGDDTFFAGQQGAADKFVKAVDRVQGGEFYVGYRWQAGPVEPYLTAGVAQFWHRVTQTHDTDTLHGTVRADDITLHGTYLSARIGGGACYRWLCGDLTYYKGLNPGTQFPIATDAVVPTLMLNIPIL